MRRILLAIIVLAFAAQPAWAGVDIVPVHIHDSASCDIEAWSWTACGHIQNEAKVITAPGVVGSGAFTYLTATGNSCADLFDVSRTIPGDATRTVQAGGSFGTDCSDGTFFYELDTLDTNSGAPVLGAIHIGKDQNADNSGIDEHDECVRQPYVWCERTRVFDTGRDTQADFRFSTRPLLVQVVNNTPNPIRRLYKGITSRGLLRSSLGDTALTSLEAYRGTPAGGSAWLGGLRRTGATSCPTDPATGKPEADCVATKVGHSSLGGVYRILPAAGPVAADYAGGEIAFTVRVRTDGVTSSTCTPMYRPTLPPLTCSVEFGGSNDGVLTATVTIKASGA
jgi:hypothetical protein